MNPETRYTNRFRTWLKTLAPLPVIVKHSDRFNNGIADLMIGIATGGQPVVFPVEVKYMSCVVKTKRKIPLKDAQQEYLLNWERIKAPAYVLVGTKGGSACYPISEYDGNIYAEDITEDKIVWASLLTHSTRNSVTHQITTNPVAPSVATKLQRDSS